MIKRLWSSIAGRNRRFARARARAEQEALRHEPDSTVQTSTVRAVEDDAIVVAVIFAPPAGHVPPGLPDYRLVRVSRDGASAALVPDAHLSPYGFRGIK